MKQNREYRDRKLRTNSNSLESRQGMVKPLNVPNNFNIEMPEVQNKPVTKTYKKYLSVISNTCDFRDNLNNNSRPRRSQKRNSVERPIQPNLIISPKNRISSQYDFEFFLNSKTR